jgi:hypothetical protein
MSSSDRIWSFNTCCSIKSFVVVSGFGTGLGIVIGGSHIVDCRICLCGCGVGIYICCVGGFAVIGIVVGVVVVVGGVVRVVINIGILGERVVVRGINSVIGSVVVVGGVLVVVCVGCIMVLVVVGGILVVVCVGRIMVFNIGVLGKRPVVGVIMGKEEEDIARAFSYLFALAIGTLL